MRLSEWLARFLTPEQTSAAGRVRRRPASAPPSLYLRLLEDRRVLSVDVVDGQSFTTAENGADGTVVGTVQVTQSDLSEPLTFSISAGNDANVFLIDPNTGEITIADNTALDFETTPVWNLEITASLQSDPSITDTSTVAVHLSDVFASANVTLTDTAAALTVVDGRIRVTQGATILFDAPAEDVDSLTIDGSAAGDTLSIDFSNGNPIPLGGLIYDGQGPTTSPGDTLFLSGGTFDKATYSFTSGSDGIIELTSGSTTSTIEFRNLEPVLNTGTATDIEFVLSSANDSAVLEDAGGGYLRLRSTNGTFEATTFLAPSNSLTVRGGDGDDTFTVSALTGSFSLSIEGEGGTNTLIVDQTDSAVLAADQYRFAGFTFDQRDTPDVGTRLQPGFSDHGATVNAPSDLPAGAVFPENAVGFDSSLTIGRLLNPSLTTGTLALNLPAGDVGTILRAGFELSWSGGRTLVNEAGNDFVVYEASSNPNGPDAGMVQVHIVGIGWTQWRYEAPDSNALYPGGGTEGAFATAFDLSDFGLAIGQEIDGIRYVNMMASDRMEGPGSEQTPGSGILVAEGFVIPEDNGATSSVLPDPGQFASFPKYGNSTFDPDPLYFGMLHRLNSGAPLPGDNDVVRVTSTEVTINTDGTARPTIDYSGMNALEVYTRSGKDDITVEMSSGLPSGGVLIDGGNPTDSDVVTLLGTTGAQTITLSGTSATADGRTVTLANIEQVIVDVGAVGTGDTVVVDRTFTLPGNSSSLQVFGDGLDDKLLVDLSTGGSTAIDDVAIDHDSVAVTNGITADYQGISEVELLTGGGADTIRVTPCLTTAYLIDGGAPTIATNPGDRVTFDIAALGDPLMTVTGIGSATLTSTTHASVSFIGIDSYGSTTPFDVEVSAAANPLVGADAFSIVRNGAADQITVNGAIVFRADRSAIDLLTVTGSADDDTLTIDFTSGDPIPAGGITFLAGSQVVADTLHFIGDSVDTVTHRFDSVNSGATTFAGTTIDYSDIEAIQDEIEAKTRIFTFTADVNDILLDDDLVLGDNWSRIMSNHGAYTTFLSPSETAIVNAGSGDDVVVLWGLDSQFAADLVLRGQTGNDTIFLDSNGTGSVGGNVDWITFPIYIDGGGDAEDSLTIEDSTSASSKSYSISNVSIGGTSPPSGAAVDTPDPSPTVDGTITPGEWTDIPIAFDTGARPAPSLQTILHYDFSEANNPTPGSSVGDSTSNDVDGGLPVTPGPNFRENLGRFGGALQFNGTTDFAWFQSALFDVGAQGSLSFWVNLADASRRSQIVEGPGNNGLEFQYRNSGALGQFYASPNNSGDNAIAAGAAQATFQNVWTNVQYSWQRTSATSGELHVYINGTEVTYLAGSDSTITNWNTVIDTIDRFMTVGRDPVTGGRYLNGMLDDMAWFNTALTGAQLAAISSQTVGAAQGSLGGVYNAVGAGGNLIAYWNMDDAVGTTVVQGDGGTSIELHTAPEPARFMPTGGKIGGALEFNSPESFATFQDAGFDVGAQGTLSFWVFQRDADRRNQFIEGPGDSGFEFQYRNQSSTTGQFYASPNRGAPGNTEDYAIETVKTKASLAGTWHNMQYTWNFADKSMHIYRDGVEVSYAGSTDQNIGNWNSVVNTINGLFTVGRDPGAATQDRWFDGKLDDIAFFNSVLSQADRDAIRLNAGGVGGAQAALHGVLDAVSAGGNLVAYWNLDDAVGTTAVSGDGGTNITLNLNVPTKPEGAAFHNDGGPVLANGGNPIQLDSLDFDGNRDYIRTLDDPALDFSKTSGTISLWVKPRAHGVDNDAATGISSLLEDSNRQISLGISWQTNAGASLGNADLFGRVVFSPWENVSGASTNVVVSNTRLSFDTWTQVTVTWDYATHTAVIYLNGVADSTLINNTANPAIWAQPAGNTGDYIFGGDGLANGRWFDGEMADIAIYGSALKPSEVQTIVEKGASATGGYDLAGAKGHFTWDATNLYGLIESYPAGAGSSNGPFDNLEIEIFINNGTTVAARLDGSVLVPVNNIAGSAVAPNGNDVTHYEFSIPLSAIVDGGHTFDPDAGDFLTYRIRTIDGDVPTGGFDTRDTTLGWVVEPPLAANGYRQMDFAKSENFFAPGGRLNYSGIAHLTVNGGTGNDEITIVDSQANLGVASPSKTFTLNSGDGDDTITVESIDADFRAAITIDGQAGTDSVTVDAALTLGSDDSTGDLAIDAETIALNQAIDVTGSTLLGSVGNVTLTVGDLLTIVDDADITALGNVLIDGTGDVETAGDIETAVGNITIERPVTLTDDIELTATLGDVSFSGAAATVEGNKKLTITAEAGAVTFDADVGAVDPLDVVTIDAKNVVVNGVVKTADQSGVDTIVVATDEIEINAGGGLDAGAGIIALAQLTDDRPLTLGEDAVGTLGLNGDELTRITADTLRFGDDFSGAISVLSMPTLPSVATLHLTTNRGVSGDGAIVVANLAITSVDDISLTGASDVDTFAAETFTTGAGISFNEANSFVLDYVDGVFGIYTDDGLAELIAADGLSQTVDGDIFSGALRLAGTGLFDLPNPTNAVDILTAAIDGSVFYSDFDGLSIGSAFGTEGITTAGGDVVILSGESLDLYRPIDAGVGSVLLGSALAIEDVGPTGTKIAADTLILASVAGIGNSRAIETSVRYLSAFNLSTGTINISDVSGSLLSIDLLGLTNLASGGISLLHVGGLDVTGEVFSAGGTIAFTSIANGGDDDDLVINAPLLLSGGTGDIVLQGGTDLLVNDTSLTNDIRTTGSGSIIGTAGRDVTIGSDVIIRSATGAITDIPPLLENLLSPQIAATGFSMVTFDYGRLNEFNFTALVDWSDGTVDLLGLGAPGTTGAAHFYTGNPNLADPAAPITIAVTLRSDARIRFTGYETTTLTVTVSFPGDGVRNVRIDTTAKVPHLTAPPPTRIVDVPLSVSFNLARNSVTGAAGLVAGIEKTADRVLILREVLPDGREGTSMRFNEDKLNHLDEVFSKVRDGRYRLYLFEPGTRTLRLVVDVYVRDGKPAAADDARESRQDRPDGARLDRPVLQAAPTTAADEVAQPSEDSELGEVSQAESAERPQIEDRAHFVTPSATQPAMAASALVAGAALVAADRTTWHERVDAALSKVRSYSRVRSRSTRRPPR